MTRLRAKERLWIVVVLAALTGCQQNFLTAPRDDLRRLPPALPTSPQLQQVIAVINNNAGRIQSFHTDQASISIPGFPSLRTSIDFQRPRRFRLRAELPLGTGQAVDIGSNDELFWFWLRYNEPKAVYYCRHGQFAFSPLRRAFPVDPYWLIESLGLVELDPAQYHQGPFRRNDGSLEIRTVLNTEQGPATKIKVVEGRQGLVLGQYLYDARSQLVASAIAGRHRRDPLTGLFMPAVVELRTTATDLSPAFTLRIDLNLVEINRPIPNAEHLWTMPSLADSPAIDICGGLPQASPVAPGPIGPSPAAPSSIPQQPAAPGPGAPSQLPPSGSPYYPNPRRQ